MKKPLLFLGGLLALTVAGCDSNKPADADANILVDSNFDTLAGWLPEAQSATLSRAKAHSGRYSLMVDGGHEYSLSYRMPLGQLHETRMQKLKVTAWAFVPSPAAQASLVMVISSPDPAIEKPLLWEALNLSAGTKPGIWAEVSKEITLPASVAPSSALSIYLWRTGGNQPVYLDDLRVTLLP